MARFTIVDNIDQVCLSDDWKDAVKFNSKGRVVGEDGKPIAPGYAGRQYRLLVKKERILSSSERSFRWMARSAKY